MKKKELKQKTDERFNSDKSALQVIWDNVNKGQKKQIRKNPQCADILDRYGIVDEK